MTVQPGWVTAYEVDRCYGGPEEGGWWYDTGRVLESVPVDLNDDAAVDGAKVALREKFGPQYQGARHRSSVIGEPNLEIYVEEHAPRDFPQETPHYE